MAEKLGSCPIVTISRRGADRIRAGHVWVYRSDIVDASDVEPGALVVAAEEQGGRGRPAHTRLFGSALYRSASQIALSILLPRPVEDLGQLLRGRIRNVITHC